MNLFDSNMVMTLVFGIIVPFALCLGVPIFIVSMVKKRKRNREEEYLMILKKQEAEIRREQAAQKSKKEQERVKQEFEFLKKREIELQQILNKYERSPITLEAAKFFCESSIIPAIEGHKRSFTEKNIEIKFQINQYITLDKITGCINDSCFRPQGLCITVDRDSANNIRTRIYDQYFDFKEHHLKYIEDKDEFSRFHYAVLVKICEIVNEKFSLDPSGTIYELIIADCKQFHQTNTIIYKAINGKYITPKDW